MPKISVTSYSLHRHIGKEISLLDFPRLAREEFGLDAIELINSHIESVEREYLDALKNNVAQNRQRIVHISAGHGNISQRDEKQRLKDVQVLLGWLDVASYLGAPAIRIDTGSQQGDPDLSITIDSYERLAARARKLGLKITLENHGGISWDPQNIVQIIETVGTDVMGTCPDLMNYLALDANDVEGVYAKLRVIAPYAVILHAKGYEFGPDGEEKHIEYARLAEIFESFDGYWSVEFEGPGDQYDGVRKTIALIRKHVRARSPAVRSA